VDHFGFLSPDEVFADGLFREVISWYYLTRSVAPRVAIGRFHSAWV
jgi:hypothetical protein